MVKSNDELVIKMITNARGSCFCLMYVPMVYIRSVLTACLCLFTFASPNIPTTTHTLEATETIQTHLEITVDQVHWHEFGIDPLLNIQRHAHDIMDHDHNQAFISASGGSIHLTSDRDKWRLNLSLGEGHNTFNIERPPCV